jgi:hypothetical protein
LVVKPCERIPHVGCRPAVCARSSVPERVAAPNLPNGPLSEPEVLSAPVAAAVSEARTGR